MLILFYFHRFLPFLFVVVVDARALLPAETGAAATNAYNMATALATTEVARVAIKVLLKATGGVFSLVGRARNLPAIVAGEVGLSGFPRLKKLMATGAITTARLRGSAVRVGLRLTEDTDSSETASVDWVWNLAMISRGITLKAIGLL